MQQIFTAAERHGRKVALVGRSMLNVFNAANNLGYIQKNTIYPCAAAEAVDRDDVKIATEKYPGVADFIIDMDELHTTPEKAKARGEAILAYARMLAKSK